MAATTRRRVLMVAFHFPPVRGSSGLQRTLKFANYLPQLGWNTTVLSASVNAYADTTNEQLSDIAPGVRVRRAWCLDAKRHLSVNGVYPRWAALPDRWANWAVSAVALGLLECQQRRPDVIWSTFPIATAQRIGATLHRLTGIPWVADLRDSMTEDHYPRDPKVRAVYRRIEADVVAHAAAVVFTTPSTRNMYAQRYPSSVERWRVIANGYDEENFAAAERQTPARHPGDRPLLLLHSGLLDPTDRDPLPFFDAVADMKRAGEFDAAAAQIVLRASGHDPRYRTEIEARGIADIVRLEPALPYVEALAEMLSADALLLFQASCCNHQIPAKLYEYFRARRPILCITDPQGDTAAEARAAGIEVILPIAERAALRHGLHGFLSGAVAEAHLRASEDAIARSSRRGQAAELADVFGSLVRVKS